MAHSKDAAVQGMKPSTAEPMIDCVSSEAGFEQLLSGHHPVLGRGEVREVRVEVPRGTRLLFTVYLTANVNLVAHAPRLAPKSAPMGPETSEVRALRA